MITAMFIFGAAVGVIASRALMRNDIRVDRARFAGVINASKLNK